MFETDEVVSSKERLKELQNPRQKTHLTIMPSTAETLKKIDRRQSKTDKKKPSSVPATALVEEGNVTPSGMPEVLQP